MITWRTIISRSTGSIFTVFSPNGSVLDAVDRSGPLFLIYQRDVAMATNFVKKWQTPSFLALAFRNGMEYRYLNVRINSINDAYISGKNFVNFRPVSPELIEIICEHLVRHSQKTDVFSRISQDILDQFSQSFHHVKALCVQMIDLYLIFRFVKGRYHGDQTMLGETRK